MPVSIVHPWPAFWTNSVRRRPIFLCACKSESFKSKTQDRLCGGFKRIVSSSMDEVEVLKSYLDIAAAPFASVEWLDLDHDVTTEALDGLS